MWRGVYSEHTVPKNGRISMARQSMSKMDSVSCTTLITRRLLCVLRKDKKRIKYVRMPNTRIILMIIMINSGLDLMNMIAMLLLLFKESLFCLMLSTQCKINLEITFLLEIIGFLNKIISNCMDQNRLDIIRSQHFKINCFMQVIFYILS